MAAVGADVTAAALIPRHPSLSRLREAAAGCRACELWRKGTQTVFGEGSPGASVMLVGEQPGDREDLIGHPFIGPAGALLDRALAEAGISRDDVYLTNVVKHFNWEARGKRRIHRKPNLGHIRACRPWLDAEIKLVDPEVLVLLGRPPPSRSLAATSGSPGTEASSRTPRSPPWSWPRSIPRRSSARDSATRDAELEAFVRDFRVAAGAMRR
jgi:uracil-DNA glycosylase family protein